MDPSVYAVEAAVEETHWWFVGRRELFAREIERLGLRKSTRVLDVGTGTGANLRMLRGLGFADVVGLDASADAIRYCEGKGLGPVTYGDVCALPYEDKSFELVLATDVIEHVDDDLAALEELRRVLVPGGVCLISVPAFQSLWGLQDEIGQHRRRYRLNNLMHLIEQAGHKPLVGYYFNYVLFVPIWAARRAIRLLNLKLENENKLGTPLINGILKRIFRFDILTARAVRPRFGVSALAVTRRAE